jgi:hypothetical protein
MHVGGRCVAWAGVVDDDDGAPLTCDLERGSKTGTRAADYGDVAVSLNVA